MNALGLINKYPILAVIIDAGTLVEGDLSEIFNVPPGGGGRVWGYSFNLSQAADANVSMNVVDTNTGLSIFPGSPLELPTVPVSSPIGNLGPVVYAYPVDVDVEIAAGMMLQGSISACGSISPGAGAVLYLLGFPVK